VSQDWGEFVYVPAPLPTGERIVLPADEAHHLFRVRRMSMGRTVFVTDGEGRVLKCVAEADQSLRIEETLPEFGEPARPLWLCLAVLKGDTNREVVDTATQLGVTAIVLFQGQRSEGRVQEDKREKFRRVAITAIKQCGRARLPRIELASSLEAALSLIPGDLARFLAHPEEEETKERSSAPADHGSALIVGPEGGLTNGEVGLALEAGCRTLSLGNRRLRAETAVAAGLTLLQEMGCRI
jgi:16S rRNA (uracil1498-N3)-methyltransferase